MRARSHDYGDIEVEDVGCRSVVMEEGWKSVGGVGDQLKFAEDRPERLAGQVGVCTLFETHPAVASSRTGCCIVPSGTMHAHTATAVGAVLPCRKWVLSRTDVEVRRGADFP